MDGNDNNQNNVNVNAGLPINPAPVDGSQPPIENTKTQSPTPVPTTSAPVSNENTSEEANNAPLDPYNKEITGGIVENQKILDLEREKQQQTTLSSSKQSGAVNKVGDDPNRAPATGEISTFDEKDKVSEEGAKVLKEQAKAKSLEIDEELPNINAGPGINLIPTKTKAEVKKEKTRTGINLFSAFAILVLVFFSVVILGLNAGMKIWLNREISVKQNLENDLLSQTEVIRANQEILARFNLYQDVQQVTFSPKEVLIYWRDLVSDFGVLDGVELKSGLNFSVNGGSDDLKQLAFLWHLLTVDDKVNSTNLKGFSKTEEGSTFRFDGEINFDYFANQSKFLSNENLIEEPEEEVEEE